MKYLGSLIQKSFCFGHVEKKECELIGELICELVHTSCGDEEEREEVAANFIRDN